MDNSCKYMGEIASERVKLLRVVISYLILPGSHEVADVLVVVELAQHVLCQLESILRLNQLNTLVKVVMGPPLQ